jgi:hypothetical protein
MQTVLTRINFKLTLSKPLMALLAILPLFLMTSDAFLQRFKALFVHSMGWLWCRTQPPFATYASEEEEQKYWKDAERYRKCLDTSDARVLQRRRTGEREIPLVPYYTPALLPVYRDRRRPRKRNDYFLSAKDFRKWHRMVFRHSVRSNFWPNTELIDRAHSASLSNTP